MNNFIESFQFSDTSICDELIEYHKNNKQVPGYVSGRVDRTIKASTDVALLHGKELDKYCIQLQQAVDNYISIYEWCNKGAPWMINECTNIQHYKPNEGFFAWHCERHSLVKPAITRHLAFMTYLNDVEDGGETEFLYQKVKFKPKKGLTLIFPVEWTHTHRGITSPTQDKYIATSWFNYTDECYI
jgi:hypothetical protein